MYHLKPEATNEDDIIEDSEESSSSITNPIIKLRKLALWIQKRPQRYILIPNS